MATILYARVSTADQTIAHQKTHAESAGFKIDRIISDAGVSGVTVPLRERDQGKRLFDILRPGDTLVVRWLDRLGRNYQDVTDTVREFMRQGIIIKTVINGMTFDGATQDPMQQAVRDALISFMAATAQAQAEATKEAQRAGIEHAKAEGVYMGRKPTYTREQLKLAGDAFSLGKGATEVGRLVGVTRVTAHRMREDPAGMLAALDRWGL